MGTVLTYPITLCVGSKVRTVSALTTLQRVSAVRLPLHSLDEGGQGQESEA